MAKRARRPPAQRAAEKAYEGRGVRPGTAVSTRLSEAELKLFDAAAEEAGRPRAGFLLDLIRVRLGINEPLAAKRRKKGG